MHIVRLILERLSKRFKQTDVEAVVGCAGYKGPRVSLSEMNALVEKEARSHK